MKTKTGEVRLTEPGRRETKEHAEAHQDALSGFIRVARYQRNEFLRYALAGDWAPLAKYIRDGGRVTPRMRPFLADVLDRKRPRPRVKISRWATRRRNGEIAGFIFDARFRGEKEKEYSKAAEKKFGLTWRHIQKIVAEEELRSETDKILQNDWQGILLLNPPSDNGGIKYRLSDMALSPHTLP
jgi:hypothetical protein